MRFRILFTFMLSLILLDQKLQAQGATPLSAGTPVGLIIRNQFFSQLGKNLSLKPLQMPLKAELGNHAITGEINLSILGITASNEVGSGELSLAIHLKDTRAVVNLSLEGTPYAVQASQADFVLPITVRMKNLYHRQLNELVKIDQHQTSSATFNPDLKMRNLSAPQDDSESYKRLEDWIKAADIRTYLWTQLKDLLQREISLWLYNRLSGITTAEPIIKLMPDSPLLNDGRVMQKGGLSIELEGKPLSKRNLFFVSRPYSQGGLFIKRDSIELYVDSLFLAEADISKLFQAQALQMNTADITRSLQAEVSDAAKWPVGQFKSLNMEGLSTSELTLAIPISLINLALTTIYREGLLRFRTLIDLGKQTQNIVSKEAPDVKMVVGISPQAAPRMNLEGAKPRLHISDYMLDVSTMIEDRLIPSSRILTTASIDAGLALESSKSDPTVNLVLAPDTFEMDLKLVWGQMSARQEDVFKRIAKGLWKTFLSRYSNLVLFGSLLQTDTTDLKIVGLDVANGHIFLHANLDWGAPTP